MPFPTVPLGKQGLRVPRLGYGSMGLSWAYAPDPSTAATTAEAVFDKLVASGATFIDTAWIYGFVPGIPHSEEVIGAALRKHGRDAFQISEKIGVDIRKQPPFVQSADELRGQLEESLARLGTTYVDILFLNRPDPRIPIETTWAVMAQFVAEGKAKYVGLSEASPDEVRRAHAVHPVTAIQQEWSLDTRDIEQELVPTCRELGVGVLAYSPLGRGMLAGAVKAVAELAPNDWRRSSPRFSAANIDANVDRATRLAALASRRGITPAQLALLWLLAQGEDVVPIPGTTKLARLDENLAVASMPPLSEAEAAEIAAAVPEAVGERYAGMHGTFNSKLKGGAHHATHH